MAVNEAINTTWVRLSAHKSQTETLSFLEEVLGAKFKLEKLSKQFGCYGGSKFGFYGKVAGLKSAYCSDRGYASSVGQKSLTYPTHGSAHVSALDLIGPNTPSPQISPYSSPLGKKGLIAPRSGGSEALGGRGGEEDLFPRRGFLT